MKAVIIEDEPLVAKDLQKLIARADSSIEVIALLDSVKSGINYFSKNPEPDLVFMDIQLSDGVSFDILNKVQIKCPIIFTSAYNEYAVRAFKVNSIDYLLKPIDKNDLTAALEKFKRLNSNSGLDLKEQMQSLMKHLNSGKDQKIYKERFTVHSGKSFLVVNNTDIAYFKKETLIYIAMNDKQQYISDFNTMEEIEELVNPKLFFRANRQYILSAGMIDSYRTDSYSKLVVKLKDPLNITVDISREKAQAFKNWLG